MFLLEVFLLLKIIQRKSEKDLKNFLNTFPMTIKITDMTMFSNYCSFCEFQFLIVCMFKLPTSLNHFSRVTYHKSKIIFYI